MTRLLAAGAVVIAALVASTATLAVAAQQPRVTLTARPTSLGPVQNALLFGTVASGRAGEPVKLQAKPCGLTTFRTVSLLQTTAGGTFRSEYGPGVNTTLRAAWKGVTSATVTVRQAPLVQLDQTSPGEWEVGVGSLGMMWRKRVEIQRRTGSRWIRVRPVVLTETYSSPGSSGVWTDAHFTMSVPRGTLLRAVLTAAQARPCYLGSVSNTVRT